MNKRIFSALATKIFPHLILGDKTTINKEAPNDLILFDDRDLSSGLNQGDLYDTKENYHIIIAAKDPETKAWRFMLNLEGF